MSDNSRIDDLRRRVQKDPASIAFAQLAEECRRAGRHEEAVEVCRAGLDIHPAYLSARVTLGRALIELNLLDDAQTELEFVLKSAPENLAAIRGLAEIHHRRGSLVEALAQYRAALLLARNNPDLERTVAELERAVEPPKPPVVEDGLSFEQMQSEFLKDLPPPPPAPAAVELDAVAPAADNPQISEMAALKGPPYIEEETAALKGPPYIEEETAALKGPPYIEEETAALKGPSDIEEETAALEGPPYTAEPAAEPLALEGPSYTEEPAADHAPIPVEADQRGSPYSWAAEQPALEAAPPDSQTVEDFDDRERDTRMAMKTIVALERFLDAIHVARTQPGA